MRAVGVLISIHGFISAEKLRRVNRAKFIVVPGGEPNALWGLGDHSLAAGGSQVKDASGGPAGGQPFKKVAKQVF